MPDIQDYIGMNDIKGPEFDPAQDSLHKLNQKTAEVSSQTSAMANQTELIRSDTGELNGSAINNLYVTNDLTLTGNITVKNLYILDGATISGNYTVIVQENCYIYSSHIYINTLDVKGDLIIERQVGDNTTINLFRLSTLNLLGTGLFNNCNIVGGTHYIEGDASYNESTCTNNIYLSGQFTALNCTFDASVFNSLDVIGLTGSDFSFTTINFGGTSTLINTNVTGTDLKVNGAINYSGVATLDISTLHAKGNCIFSSGIIITHIKDWNIDGNLVVDSTLPIIDNMKLKALNFSYAGSSISSNTTTTSTSLEIEIYNTFTAPNLTSITLADAQDGGQYPYSGGHLYGYGGGATSYNIYIENADFNNPVSIYFGDGGDGGDSVGPPSYYGTGGCGGGGGVSGGAGGLGGQGATSGPSAPGYHGKAGVDSTSGNFKIGTLINKNFSITHNSIAGSHGSDMMDHESTNGEVGAPTSNSTSTIPVVLPQIRFKTPTLITPINAIDISLLEFSCPTHIDNVDFDFELVIQQQFTEKIFQTLISVNTNDNASVFSGTPPYVQGSSNITYTLPTLSTGTYRWRVKTLKDLDITKESLFTDWRIFTKFQALPQTILEK